MKLLILATAEAYRKRLRYEAEAKGHRVRVQADEDGPAETRTKVRWADTVVAAGNLPMNAVGALYLAFELKKTVQSVEVDSPRWVREYWHDRSLLVWVDALPVMPEQTKLFT